MEKSLRSLPSPALGPGEDVTIDLDDGGYGPDVTPTEDGGVIVNMDPNYRPPPEELPFGANLAEHISEEDLAGVSSDLMELFEADKLSRQDWERAYTEGMDLLGFSHEDRSDPFDGACGVFHPLLAEAVVRFEAQAITEIFPASGPVKTQILGRMTPEKTDQAGRVQEHMNYYLTEVMEEYRPETERLLFSLALAGSAFRKVYYDPTLGRPSAMFVQADDFVISFGASTLRMADRYTHVMRRSRNEIKKLQVAGFYREMELPDAAPEYSNIEEKEAKTVGSEPVAQADDRLQLLEIHADVDLPGFEDPDGIALPYVVTIIKSSGDVLSIRRNWLENDPLRKKRLHFVPYSYIQGPGFYGYGLIHLIGGIAKSSTSLLRQLVDAGTLSNLPGGFKTKGARIENDADPIAPGEWRDMDVGSGVLKDNIVPLPYKEPSAVLYQLMTNLIEDGRRFASLADMKISDMSSESPVGTTLAIIERSMKVMSGIQARLHASMRREFSILSGIIRDNLPPVYEYDVNGGDRMIKQMDYDDKVDVLPVSDPNASTLAQRLMQHQASLQLAAQAPEIYDLPELHKRMQEALGIKDLEAVIPSIKERKPEDPVSENASILANKPVKVFPWQDHESHIKVHLAAVQDPKLQEMIKMSPMAQSIMGAAAAHIQEHLGHAYRRRVEEAYGAPLPEQGEPLPPEVEIQLSKAVADAADKVLARNTAEQRAEENRRAEEDPVLQMQRRELDLKEKDIERRANTDMLRILSDMQMEMMRMRQEMMEFRANKQEKQMEMGVDIAKDLSQGDRQQSQAALRAATDLTRQVMDNVEREEDRKVQRDARQTGGGDD